MFPSQSDVFIYYYLQSTEAQYIRTSRHIPTRVLLYLHTSIVLQPTSTHRCAQIYVPWPSGRILELAGLQLLHTVVIVILRLWVKQLRSHNATCRAWIVKGKPSWDAYRFACIASCAGFVYIELTKVGNSRFVSMYFERIWWFYTSLLSIVYIVFLHITTYYNYILNYYKSYRLKMTIFDVDLIIVYLGI